MLMTQLDHSSALSPSTPLYKPDLDPSKPLTLPMWTPIYPPSSSHSRHRPKPKKRDRVCLTKRLFSSLLSRFLCSPEGSRAGEATLYLPPLLLANSLDIWCDWELPWRASKSIGLCPGCSKLVNPRGHKAKQHGGGYVKWEVSIEKAGGLVQMTAGRCHYCFAFFLWADDNAEHSHYTWGEVVGHQVEGCQGSSTRIVINETGRCTTGSSAARATLALTTQTPDTVWYKLTIFLLKRQTQYY